MESDLWEKAKFQPKIRKQIVRRKLNSLMHLPDIRILRPTNQFYIQNYHSFQSQNQNRISMYQKKKTKSNQGITSMDVVGNAEGVVLAKG